MYIWYNANPSGKFVGDCVIRAITLLTGRNWLSTYDGIYYQGRAMYDMMASNSVWGEFLFQNGYRRHYVSDICPYCMTVKDFCWSHPYGKYLLATGSHVIAVIDGNYYDTWDSGREIPIYYYKKEK